MQLERTMVGPGLLARTECMFHLLNLVERYKNIQKVYCFRLTAHRVFIRTVHNVVIRFEVGDSISNGKHISNPSCYCVRQKMMGCSTFQGAPLGT